MSQAVGSQTSWIAGISFNEKQGVKGSYGFGRSIDHRSDPTALTITPKAISDAGSVITDLAMWGTRACSRNFFYGNAGNIYQESSGTWSLAHAAADSVGNGLGYFTSDGHLYYAQNTTFGRLTDACTGATFYDDLLGQEGGDPTNTKSLDLERSSSMYASRADTASTSITADLTLEPYCKLESLPATDEIYTIISKWDEQTNKRSYKMDITTSSNFFGDGRDGALTISSNTTEAPIDANCTGTSGENTLTVTNAHASFASVASGDQLLIHQTRGTNAGVYELNEVLSYAGGVVTLLNALSFSPVHSATASVANKAQTRVLKQYTNVTINTGVTYTTKAWDGLKGGIIGWYANGTVTVTGTLSANGGNGSIVGSGGYSPPPTVAAGGGTGGGFRGGNGEISSRTDGVLNGAYTGESYNGPTVDTQYTANGGAGGGGCVIGAFGRDHSAAGGGSYATAGTAGVDWYGDSNSLPGLGGGIYGSSDLSTLFLGSGGGGGWKRDNSAGGGGAGGGAICVFGATTTITGLVTTTGGIGYNAQGSEPPDGGGGSGGSVLIKCETGTLGTNKITTTGASASNNGGAGGDGRVRIEYSDSFTGSTTLTGTFSSAEDNNLGASSGYVLRLHISDDGTASEIYKWDITDNIDITTWRRYQIKWENLTSTAEAFINGVTLGTKTGAMTAIDDNASKFAIGCDFDSSGDAQHFYDGLLDDLRVWNDERTVSEMVNNNDRVLYGTEANLIAYYEFTDDLTDSQTNGLNDLTGTNSPTYSADVPFSGVTTRQDTDQSNDQTGQTYTLPTAISEAATALQTFIPEKEPWKSIEVDINTVGTGNWTLTIHDGLNRTQLSLTIANAQLHTGIYEFVFDDIWRPILGATYHFHLTSTVADGVVVTGTTVDLETARYWGHFQFLIDDKYHPITQMLDFMVIGNERYLAKFEAGDTYDPHKLTLPSGYRIRCLAKWRNYLAIGTWRGDNIYDYDEGWIFLWDGVSDTYNHYFPVSEGGINSMFGNSDVLFMVAGYTGEILVYNGSGSAQKLNKIPKIANNKYTEIAPGAMNMWRTLLHVGVDLLTDSEAIHKGAYTIGTSSRSYPISLGFDYPTSLGDQISSNVKVGLVYPSGQDLYMSWQNNNAYGIDKISVGNSPYGTAEVNSLITDFGKISKEQYPLVLRADFLALASGESIELSYKADRASSWETNKVEDTADATELRMRVPERCKEFQYKCELKTTTTTSPTVTGISIETELENRSRRNA